MPTYEYRCENGHEFEAFQKMSEDPLDVCPECGAAAERKISSGAGLVFRGSGFYVTDYKRSGEKKGERSGEKSSGEAARTNSSGDEGGTGDGTGGNTGDGADSAAGSKES